MVEGGDPVVRGGGGAAPTAPQRLPVRVGAARLLRLLAASRGVQAQQARHDDAELEEDDGGGGGDDDGQRGAQQLALLVAVDEDCHKIVKKCHKNKG